MPSSPRRPAAPDDPGIQIHENADLNVVARPRLVVVRGALPVADAISVSAPEAARQGSDRRAEFLEQAARWRAETQLVSSTTDLTRHPDFVAIVAMGPAAIPWILRELDQRGGHWALALKRISGAQPVRPDDAGRVDRIREAWLQWGRENGHRW